MRPSSEERLIHFICIPFFTWGHFRPILNLSLNLLTVYPQLRLTLLLTPTCVPRVQTELQSSYLRALAADLGSRLQIIRSGGQSMDEDMNAVEGQVFAEQLPALVTPLLKGEGHVGVLDQRNRWEGLRPSFVLHDLFCSFTPPILDQVCKSLSVPIPPLVGFYASTAAGIWQIVADTSRGGCMHAAITSSAAAIASGTPVKKAWEENYRPALGKVLQIPGLPQLYDYEYQPLLGAVSGAIDGTVNELVAGSYHVAHHLAVTALAVASVPEYEEETKAAVEREAGKPLLMCGFQFPRPAWEGAPAVVSSDSDRATMAFLDRMLAKHGARQTIYIGLGSLFFPDRRLDLLYWMHDVLFSLGIPFIQTYAAPTAGFPQAYLDQMAREHKGECHFVQVSPQWAVMQHSAVGAIVAHCGSNTTCDAILNGQPIIAMPFLADQVEITQNMVQKGIALELIQVKTFVRSRSPLAPPDLDLRRLYDGRIVLGTEAAIRAEYRETFEKVLRGPEGAAMRAAAGRLRAVACESHKRGGAREAMRAFEQYF